MEGHHTLPSPENLSALLQLVEVRHLGTSQEAECSPVFPMQHKLHSKLCAPSEPCSTPCSKKVPAFCQAQML